jgi:putative hydrolase of the HAD superfamily
MLRGVFFDLDGTLIAERDTQARRVALAAAWGEAFGQPVTPDALEAAIRTAYEERFLYGQPGYADLAHLCMRDFLTQLFAGARAVLATAGADGSDRFLQAWGEIEWQAVAVAPGAVAVLEALRGAGLVVGLITNGPSCLQREKLSLLNLAGYLDPILVDTEYGCPKPDRRIFEHAASLASLTPEQLMFVGDTPAADIAGAVGAGWTAAWISTGGACFPDGLPLPHHTIGALTDLLALPPVQSALAAARR